MGPVFSVGETLAVQDSKEVKQVSSLHPTVNKKKINKANSVTSCFTPLWQPEFTLGLFALSS